MIRSFKHKGLESYFRWDNAALLPSQHIKRIERILDRLAGAEHVRDMNLPGYKLHRLRGTRKAIWSIAVSGNWRVTFEFESGEAYDVNLEDYH